MIAGCGGGFDVYCGLPIAVHLHAMGRRIAFANLSFSNLSDSNGEQIDSVTWRIDAHSREMPYFPEKWLVEWLARNDMAATVYAFEKCGAGTLAEAYRKLLTRHLFDLVILVDGGTDSVIFGDEPGLGTIVEDAVSLVAACAAAPDRTLLVSLGFGIDHFHGVSHHSFLENVARIVRDGGYLGGYSLVAGTKEAETFLSLVDYANARQPRHKSIVCNSIASSIRGEFGDFHTTDRTGASELFINPLMSYYWTFDAMNVVRHVKFAPALIDTETFHAASAAIEAERARLPLRPRRPIPL